MKDFIAEEIKKPTVPRMTIPIAEIFATDQNSFFVGFVNTCQTLFDLRANDFKLIICCFTIN